MVRKTIPGVFTPGITQQRTSVSSVEHSYAELVEVLQCLEGLHALTQNFCDSCKTVAQYWGYGYTFVTIPGGLCIHSGLIQKVYDALGCHILSVSHTNRTPNSGTRSTILAYVDVSFVSQGTH